MGEDCSISLSVEDYHVMFSLISSQFTFAGMLRVPLDDLIVSCISIPNLFVGINFFQGNLKKKTLKPFYLLNVCICLHSLL